MSEGAEPIEAARGGPPKGFDRLFKRAQRGDPRALAKVRKMADEGAPQLWARWGDFAAMVRQTWINRITGDQLVMREGIERQVETLRSELAGSDPSPLERLLADRIAACWLQVHYAEGFYAQSLGKVSFAEAEYQQECIHRAQRRYLVAIKVLAQVRRLLGPSIQINVAQNQINAA